MKVYEGCFTGIAYLDEVVKKNASESAVNELGGLKSIIESGDFVGLAGETEEWGAGPVVTSDPERAGEFTPSGPPITIGPSGVSVSGERYAVVLTDYARELNWLI